MDVVAYAKNGALYVIDEEAHTCRKLRREFKDIPVDEVEKPLQLLRQFQTALKDKFGEDCPMKRGRLRFRGLLINFNSEDGFFIEDPGNYYEIVKTPFEGIPSVAELLDFFSLKTVQHSAEELRRAVILGRQMESVRKTPIEVRVAEVTEKTQKSGYMRKTTSFSGEGVKTYDFEHCRRDGNRVFLDEKPVNGGEFLANYLLERVPKIMPQLNKYLRGEIEFMKLLRMPYKNDMNEHYEGNLLKTAQIGDIDRLCALLEVTPPYYAAYDTNLKAGDKIYIIANGRRLFRRVQAIENGMTILGGGKPLLSIHKWVKA